MKREHDGIEEQDNPMPLWWLGLFYVTILFSLGYVVYYYLGDGPSLQVELDRRMREIEINRAATAGGRSGPDEAQILAVLKSPEEMKKGQGVYSIRCASCHGVEGEGLIGPNLVDSYWIHGKGRPEAVYAVIHDGVLDKGMPPWGPLLKPDEVMAVTAYTLGLKGKKVSGGKPPEGDLVD